MGRLSEMSTDGMPENPGELGERYRGLHESPVGQYRSDRPAAEAASESMAMGGGVGNKAGADECLGEPLGPLGRRPALGTHRTTLKISSTLVMPSAALRSPSCRNGNHPLFEG